MEYQGKTIVSVEWGSNISGITDNNLKNVDVLFEDNSVVTMTYQRLQQLLTINNNQSVSLESQTNENNARGVDLSNLHQLFVDTLGFAE